MCEIPHTTLYTAMYVRDAYGPRGAHGSRQRPAIMATCAPIGVDTLGVHTVLGSARVPSRIRLDGRVHV
jgi:hypothetical protein